MKQRARTVVEVGLCASLRGVVGGRLTLFALGTTTLLALLEAARLRGTSGRALLLLLKHRVLRAKNA